MSKDILVTIEPEHVNADGDVVPAAEAWMPYRRDLKGNGHFLASDHAEIADTKDDKTPVTVTEEVKAAFEKLHNVGSSAGVPIIDRLVELQQQRYSGK